MYILVRGNNGVIVFEGTTVNPEDFIELTERTDQSSTLHCKVTATIELAKK